MTQRKLFIEFIIGPLRTYHARSSTGLARPKVLLPSFNKRRKVSTSPLRRKKHGTHCCWLCVDLIVKKLNFSIMYVPLDTLIDIDIAHEPYISPAYGRKPRKTGSRTHCQTLSRSAGKHRIAGVPPVSKSPGHPLLESQVLDNGPGMNCFPNRHNELRQITKAFTS